MNYISALQYFEKYVLNFDFWFRYTLIETCTSVWCDSFIRIFLLFMIYWLDQGPSLSFLIAVLINFPSIQLCINTHQSVTKNGPGMQTHLHAPPPNSISLQNEMIKMLTLKELFLPFKITFFSTASKGNYFSRTGTTPPSCNHASILHTNLGS